MQNNLIRIPTLVEPVQFQSTDKKRFYFKSIAAQTEEPNDQNYLFTKEAVESFIASYKAKQPVLINHYKYGQSGIGYGATVDAHYEDPNLLITSYIMKGKDTPNGPFSTTDQLIEAMEDGSLKDVSVGGKILEGKCSICDLPYVNRYSEYESSDRCHHYRGGRYPVKQEDGAEEILETCFVLIQKWDGHELSLVWNASDDNALVTDMNLQMVAFISSGSPIDAEKKESLSKYYLSTQSKTEGNIMNEATLTAEKNALEAQISAKDTEIASLKATSEAQETEIATLKTEVDELKKKAGENQQSIADGEFARQQAIEDCIEAFTKTEIDTEENHLKEKVEAERKSIETLSLEKIRNRTTGYMSYAKKLYPSGRVAGEQQNTGQEHAARVRTRKNA